MGITVLGSPMKMRWNHLSGEDRELHAISSLLLNARTVMMPDSAWCVEMRPGSEDGGMLLSSIAEMLASVHSRSYSVVCGRVVSLS